MSHEANFIQGPGAVETADLHFKALSKLKIFNSNERSFDGKTNLIAVSQYYGLVFIGTSNGFIIMKSKHIFSATDPETYYQRDIVTNSKTSHLAVDFEQNHLAVGCETTVGPVLHIYRIQDFITAGLTPMKTIPLSKPFQNTVILVNELKWQPNASSCLAVCFSDGSVSCFHNLKRMGNDVFSVPNSVQARCMCWSPKGKQLVIGSSNGTLSQYTPELKFLKQLVPPPLFNGSVSVVNVLWISSFQFLAAYRDEQKPEEFPVIIVVNAPKNEPVKFINYDDITFSSTFFRAHQLYFYHQPAWNVILVASSNSIEVALLHANKDNSAWEQWLLGDASRAELPLNSEKLETFPLGIAVDYTSDQIIPWGEGTLPPAPRLLLLSSEGLLITFNFINTTENTAPLCSPPKEDFYDDWFAMKEKSIDPSNLSNMGQPGVNAFLIEKPGQMSPSVSTFSPMPFSNQEGLLTSPASANFKIQPVQTQTIFPMQNVTSNQQTQQLQLQEPFQTAVQASSDANSLKGTQKPSITFSFNAMATNQSGMKKENEYFETGEKQNLSLVSNSSAVIGREPAKPEEGKGNLVDKNNLNETDAKTTEEKGPETSPSRSTPEIAPIDESVYVTALLDEIDHFNSELKHVISRMSLKIHIGSNEEKENLRKSLERLNDINKSLCEVTNVQESKIYSLKCDIIEAFAWLEDARSRNRQRKNRTFIELKKSEDLDPMSSRIMNEISSMKYYIENQLKQLNLYLMKEWMQRQDSYRLDMKTMMTVPSTEELYKTMHLELKILSKQRLIIEELRQRVKEKTMKARSQTALITNSMDYSSKPSDNKGSSELYKLADNLLQIKIDSDEQNDRINVSDAFQIMIKNQIMEIAERSKKFTTAKQNILRDILCEREMMKTRSVNSTLASSSFIRSTSSRICSKYFTEPKESEIDNAKKSINPPLEPAPANESPGLLLANSTQREANALNDRNSEVLSTTQSVEKEASQPAETNALILGNQFNSGTPFSFGLSTSTAKADIDNSYSGVFTFSGPKGSGAASSFSDSDKKITVEKSAPFSFKAPPNLSSVLNSSGKPKSSSPATVFTSGSVQPVSMTAGDSGASTFTFKKTDVSFTPPSGSAFSLTPVKNSSPFSQKTSIGFSSFFSEVTNNKTDVSTTTTEVKTTTAVTTSTSTSIFLFSSGGNAAAVPSTAATTLSSSTFKFTVPESTSPFPSSLNATQNTAENSVKPFPTPSLSTSFVPSASSESVTNTGAVANAASKPNLTISFKAFADANPTVEKTAELGANNQEITVTTKTSTTPTTCTTVTLTTITTATPVVAATETTENNLGTTGTTVAPVQESTKAESVAKKPDAKGSDEKSVGEEIDVTVVETPKEDAAPEKSESNDGVAPAFPQQSPKTVFGGVSATNTSFVTTTTASTISFGASGKSIFGQAPPAASTTSNIFSTVSSSIFSSEKPVTARSGLFGSGTETSSSSIFGDAIAAPVTTSANVFGQVTPTTSSVTPTVQQSTGKDELGQTTQLFGDILKTGLSSDNIFGKSNFEKSGTSIFGNAAPSGTTASTTSIFGTTSSNIFSKSTFGQIPPATSNVFGQPQSESNTFFGQNICSSFGSATTTPQVQNPFASPTGFNSSPIFSQGLFDQSSNQQNPFGTSSKSIFGNFTGSSTSGGNLFQMGSGSFSNTSAEPFSSSQSTTGRSPMFQKLLGAGGFGGSPVFGGGLATDGFGAPPTFGGAATFSSPPSFGSPQKVFGSSQSTFGQNQTHTPNFQSLADQSSDGFSNLAQQNQNQAFGGNTFNQNAAFGSETTYGGESFSNWR